MADRQKCFCGKLNGIVFYVLEPQLQTGNWSRIQSDI
jgi:hypothetical protein